MSNAVSDGWGERIFWKSFSAGGAGLIAGIIYAKRTGQSSGPLIWTIAGNSAVAGMTFSGFQEAARAYRGQVNPFNSAVSGAASGFILTGFVGGSIPNCARNGILLSCIATAVDVAQVFLKGAPVNNKSPGEEGYSLYYNTTGTWRDILPFRKMSDEEWEEHLRRKDAKMQDKLDKYTKS